MIKLELADNNIKEKMNITDEAFVCYDGDEILGFCEFKMEKPKLFITKVDCEENPLADGLIRQTMSYAFDHECDTCKYSLSAKERIFSVKIIKNLEQSSIDILDFFKKINC